MFTRTLLIETEIYLALLYWPNVLKESHDLDILGMHDN